MMENGNGNGNGTRKSRKRDGALAFFVAMAAILAIVWWVRASDSDQARAGIEGAQKQLNRVAALIEANYDLLRPKTEGAGSGSGSESENLPAITIIREIATTCGIADRLIRVTPEENRKKGEVTAQVVLKGVRMQDVLRFLVELRSRYPQIFDREARLRLASRTEDRWDAGLALTYPCSS